MELIIFVNPRNCLLRSFKWEKLTMSEFIDWISKNLFAIFIVLVLAPLVFLSIRNSLLKEELCKSCGTIEKPIRIKPGSFILEIILWFFFLLPGLFYSAYRMAKKHWACPNCQSRDVIPLDSTLALKFMNDNGIVYDQSK